MHTTVHQCHMSHSVHTCTLLNILIHACHSVHTFLHVLVDECHSAHMYNSTCTYSSTRVILCIHFYMYSSTRVILCIHFYMYSSTRVILYIRTWNWHVLIPSCHSVHTQNFTCTHPRVSIILYIHSLLHVHGYEKIEYFTQCGSSPDGEELPVNP